MYTMLRDSLIRATNLDGITEVKIQRQEVGYMDVAVQPFLPDLTFLVTGRKP